MTWSAFPTAVYQQAPPYTWWNTYIRDNGNETAVAKATTAGYHFVSTGTNAIAERAILGASVDATETTTSTSYVDLATPGPSVTMTTGTKALIWMNVQLGNSTSSQAFASYGVSGATTLAPADSLGILSDNQATGAGGNRIGVCDLRALTAGSNTFFMQYRTQAGTGSFLRRRIQVMGL